MSGLGRIGQEVAKRALAFQMRVLGYDPFVAAEQAAKLGITLVKTVRDLLPEVDYLTVHTPLTPETTNLIGREEIALMKKGVRLINAARGGIYDESALLEGLQSGKLGGVAGAPPHQLRVHRIQQCRLRVQGLDIDAPRAGAQGGAGSQPGGADHAGGAADDQHVAEAALVVSVAPRERRG